MPHALPLLDDMRRHLQTEQLGRSARGYQQTDSTNQRAIEWAKEDAPAGSLVIAEHQHAGRGRLGRNWEAESGSNLLFSLVLRPAFSQRYFSFITLAGGVAVAETIAAHLPLRPRIKWPNDLLINGRKCCGMLLETSTKGSSPGPVVLGIGLNVNQEAFPGALAQRATSLLLEAGRIIRRGPLLADLLNRFEAHYRSLLHEQGRSGLRAAYKRRLAGCGNPIKVRIANTHEEVRGILKGIDGQGALRLETAEGLRIFRAGEVTLSGRLP